MRLREFLHSKGFEYSPVLDGSFERFAIGEKENNGWLVGSKYSAHFGNWATGERHFWNLQMERDLSGEEQTELTAQLARHQEAYKKAKLEKQAEAKRTAQYIWNSSKPYASHDTPHPYLLRKQIKSHGLRISSSGQLVIPIINNKEIVSLQFIDDEGQKRFLPGGKLSGSYFYFGHPTPKPNRIYLCEGYATGASIFEALAEDNIGICVAFNANNIPKVAEYLKTKTTPVTVCADNDQLTPGNPGLAAATKAQEILGQNKCAIKLPGFSPEEAKAKMTDFNDAYVMWGPEKVRKILSADTESSPPLPKQPKVKNTVPKKEGDKLTEKKHSYILIDRLAGRLLRIEKDLFNYTNTHWLEMGTVETDGLKNALNDLAGGSLPSKTVNSVYSTFFRLVPAKLKDELNLFLPSKTSANFLDGTLHLKRDIPTNTYTTEFLPHNPQDYLNSVIAVEFTKIDRTQKNELLEKLLDEAFLDDPDKEDKIKLLQEMAGAVLVPTFDQMFFLTGVSGSRKSTIVKLFIKMLKEANGSFKNISFVDPSNMEGFEIEGMINKLVNVNTDICDDKPLPRGFMKRFADGLPFQVNRKNKTAVNSMLPLLHIYACNDLPPMEEKSDAMQRRISVLEFKNDLTNGQGAKEIKYYEDIVWAHNPHGIFAFALAGLERILANGGKFTQIASSLKKVKEWRSEKDSCQQFLTAIEHGEVKGLYLHCDAKIERKKLGEEFLLWSEGSASLRGQNTFLGVFYKELAKKKFKFSNTHGVRFVYGIGIEGDAGGKPDRGF